MKDKMQGSVVGWVNSLWVHCWSPCGWEDDSSAEMMWESLDELAVGPGKGGKDDQGCSNDSMARRSGEVVIVLI